MDKRTFVEQQLEELIKKGSNKQDLLQLKSKMLISLRGIDLKTPEEAISNVIEEIEESSRLFLESTNEFCDHYVDGLSTCIYLPSFKGGDYKIKFIGGVDSFGYPIDTDTEFDIASISKMFTLLLTFKLVEYGYFQMDTKIADMDIRFQQLGNFTVEDILKLCGEIYTVGRVDGAATKEEAMKILETIYVKSDDRTKNLYTDMGLIALGEAITKVVHNQHPQLDSYDKIMKEFLCKPFGLYNTEYNPTALSIAGNGNDLGVVHDPKARILGGAIGSAGIFTHSDDLAKLAKEMYRVNYVHYDYIEHLVSKRNLQAMGTIIFPDSPYSHKGLVGLYQKHPDRENKWLQPLVYSDGSFTAQGFTGAVASFDPNNLIHNNILVNAIKPDAKKDPVRFEKERAKGFMKAFKCYQQMIVQQSLLLLIQKKYLEKLYPDESIDITKTI